MTAGRRSAPRAIVAAAAVAAAIAGCELAVPSDVPDFRCASDAPGACPAGTTCDMTAGRCVAAVVPPDTDADADAGGGEGGVDATADADAGPLDLGGQCRVDADCKSNLCGTSTILTTSIVSSTGPICTQPCCTSSDCPAGAVCFGGGTGGSYCVPAKLAQRIVPPVTAKPAGSLCTAHADCRSGLCLGSRCLDTCCVPSDCNGGSICRLKSVSAPGPSHDIWVCGDAEPGATKNASDTCTDQADCKSDVCIPAANGLCRPPCSGTASCRVQAGFGSGHCLYGASGNDYFKFCYATTTGTDAPAGASCVNDGECQSDFCDPELKRCADVCARNGDCPAGFTCRPSGVGTPFLRCVR